MAKDSDKAGEERENEDRESVNIEKADLVTVEPPDGDEDVEKPDKPISEWTREERSKVAHSHDRPSKDAPGWDEDEDQSYDERGYVRREADDELDLEGRDEKLHDVDAGVDEDSRVPATTAAMGVPKPTDLAPEGTEATVDVNTADEEELMKLRGISRDDAREIIEFREEKGGFESLNDLEELRAFARSRVAVLARQGAFAGADGAPSKNGDGKESDSGDGDDDGGDGDEKR